MSNYWEVKEFCSIGLFILIIARNWPETKVKSITGVFTPTVTHLICSQKVHSSNLGSTETPTPSTSTCTFETPWKASSVSCHTNEG
jgi:hypothetical protein